MNIYFIDYENVTSQGLKGIEFLTEADEVNLLYSKKAETMKIDMLTQLMASRANIRFLPVHVGTPNALDFQLITLLFLRYTDGNNYYIISKDSGYDCCIKTALENDAPNVFRFPNIESAINGGQKPKSQRSRRGSRQNSQNNSQAAQAQNTVQEAAQDADSKQDLVADTVQVQESISSQVQDLINAPAQDLINAPAQSQDNADAQEAVADAESSASEDSGDSGRKRTARRRGRRKSSSASQAEAVSSEESAEVSKELKEEVHEEPSKAKENQHQNQKQNQQAGKNQNQKQNQQAKDSQNHNQKQPQQNRDNQNQKPVTILSVIRRRNDVQLDLNQIDLIRAALKNTTNKQQFYNYFAKKLGQKKGIELYHSIKSSYTDLINANLI